MKNPAGLAVASITGTIIPGKLCIPSCKEGLLRFFHRARRLIFIIAANGPKFPHRIPNCWRQFITVNFWDSLTGGKKGSAAFFTRQSTKGLIYDGILFTELNYVPGISAPAIPI